MAADNTDYQEREAKAVAAIKEAIPEEFKQNLVPKSKGLFTELYALDLLFPDHYIATTVDGVGSKLILATVLGKYDTVGIDLVAMNKNDMDAHPGNGNISTFLFLDYLACQAEIEEQGITGEIIKGVIEGLGQSDTSDVLRIPIRSNLGKGETASLDELIAGPKFGYGFDLAGAMIGFVEKNKVFKALPKHDDAIIAFRSSGGHSNGYTDFRHYLLNGEFEKRPKFKKRYKGRFSIDDKMPGAEHSIGEELLTPTRIYAKLMAEISQFNIVGINNTGYGLHNFNRVGHDVQYIIANPMEEQDIFKLMQEESGFDDQKMYRKFNMGMGFFVIVKPTYAGKIMRTAEKYDIEADVVGEVSESSGTPITVLHKGGKELSFVGYG